LQRRKGAKLLPTTSCGVLTITINLEESVNRHLLNSRHGSNLSFS